MNFELNLIGKEEEEEEKEEQASREDSERFQTNCFESYIGGPPFGIAPKLHPNSVTGKPPRLAELSIITSLALLLSIIISVFSSNTNTRSCTRIFQLQHESLLG